MPRTVHIVSLSGVSLHHQREEEARKREQRRLARRTPAQIERDLRQLAWHGLRTAEFDVPAAPIDVHVHQVTHIELPRNGLNGPFPAAFGVADDDG